MMIRSTQKAHYAPKMKRSSSLATLLTDRIPLNDLIREIDGDGSMTWQVRMTDGATGDAVEELKRKSRCVSGEMRLAIAMFDRVLRDLRGGWDDTNAVNAAIATNAAKHDRDVARAAYKDALAWLDYRHDSPHTNTFHMCCSILGLSPTAARKGLLEYAEKHR